MINIFIQCFIRKKTTELVEFLRGKCLKWPFHSMTFFLILLSLCKVMLAYFHICFFVCIFSVYLHFLYCSVFMSFPLFCARAILPHRHMPLAISSIFYLKNGERKISTGKSFGRGNQVEKKVFVVFCYLKPHTLKSNPKAVG